MLGRFLFVPRVRADEVVGSQAVSVLRARANCWKFLRFTLRRLGVLGVLGANLGGLGENAWAGGRGGKELNTKDTKGSTKVTKFPLNIGERVVRRTRGRGTPGACPALWSSNY